MKISTPPRSKESIAFSNVIEEALKAQARDVARQLNRYWRWENETQYIQRMLKMDDFWWTIRKRKVKYWWREFDYRPRFNKAVKEAEEYYD